MHVIGRKGLFLHRGKAKGEMLEWLKRHAWKACIPLKGIPGSNPGLSADDHHHRRKHVRMYLLIEEVNMCDFFTCLSSDHHMSDV